MSALSPEQLQQIEAVVRKAVREEMADSGLRLDEPQHVDDAREDFRFVRRLRKGVEGVAAKIGWAVIAAILGGAVWLFTLGANTWKGM